MTNTLGEKIFDLAMATPAVVALVAARFHGGEAPQGVLVPYVTFDEIDTMNEETHDSMAGLDFTGIQFNCYARTPSASLNLRAKVREAMSAAGAMTNVVATRVSSRLFKEPNVDYWNAQLDIYFWHDPAA